MGIPVLIMGESGSGKSASLRNFKPEDVIVLNVANKPLPFRGKLPMVPKADYAAIANTVRKGERKIYVIDDSQYLMAFEEFGRAKETGYQKFTDMAVHFYNLLKFIIDGTPPDTIVYFLHHTETTDAGKVKAKTVGAMIDKHLTLEGLFSIVLLCRTDGKRHWMETQSDGYTTVKSPMGMFPDTIDNDLKAVDQTIRAYYEMEDK